MTTSPCLRIQRVTLAPGVLTAVVPPVAAIGVVIGNSIVNASDTEVHTADDSSEYIVISPGYERPITLHTHKFRPGETSFWLKNAAAATVILIWL